MANVERIEKTGAKLRVVFTDGTAIYLDGDNAEKLRTLLSEKLDYTEEVSDDISETTETEMI